MPLYPSIAPERAQTAAVEVTARMVLAVLGEFLMGRWLTVIIGSTPIRAINPNAIRWHPPQGGVNPVASLCPSLFRSIIHDDTAEGALGSVKDRTASFRKRLDSKSPDPRLSLRFHSG